MTPEPRNESDYSQRQTMAARRVLVDVGHPKGSKSAPFVNGAVQPKLNQGNVNRIPFMLPAPEIGQAFANSIEPLFAQICASTDQSRTLATLLPKRLSGELSVPKTKEAANA